jgi:hypothetical protein
MKKVMLSVLAMSVLGLAACQSTPQAPELQKTAEIPKNGEVKEVAVKPIESFTIELSPRKAVCDSVNGGQIECLQYKVKHQKTFNPLKTPIEGFTFEEGNAYILDVKQEVVANPAAGQLETKWILNKIIKKTAVPLSN